MIAALLGALGVLAAVVIGIELLYRHVRARARADAAFRASARRKMAEAKRGRKSAKWRREHGA